MPPRQRPYQMGSPARLHVRPAPFERLRAPAKRCRCVRLFGRRTVGRNRIDRATRALLRVVRYAVFTRVPARRRRAARYALMQFIARPSLIRTHCIAAGSRWCGRLVVESGRAHRCSGAAGAREQHHTPEPQDPHDSAAYHADSHARGASAAPEKIARVRHSCGCALTQNGRGNQPSALFLRKIRAPVAA